MAEISDTVLNDINRLIDELNKKQFEISDAFLFGSYAENKAKDYSDIDVALISDNFSGNRFNDKNSIRDVYLKINWKLSPYPIKKSQLQKDWFFTEEIAKKGIKVY